MPLRYLAHFPHYSAYRDLSTDGLVFVYHGTRDERDEPRGLTLDDALDAYGDGLLRTLLGRKPGLDDVAAILADPDEADDLFTCHRCGFVGHDDAGCVVQTSWGEVTYCDDCTMHYAIDCARCDTYTTEWVSAGDCSYCTPCSDAVLHWCEECDEYYHHESDDHYHNDEDSSTGCCSSPMPSFGIGTVRYGTLSNDTRVDVQVNDNVLSADGFYKLHSAIYYDHEGWFTDADGNALLDPSQRRALASYLGHDAVGMEWKNASGTYPKRLRSFAHKTLGINIPKKALEKIGTIAREHSVGINVSVEITRFLNLSADDFGHAESCWWESYAYSRCTLKSNAGFGLRSFNQWGVSGRCWVMPLTLRDGVLHPTFGEPDAYVVFNSYGELEERVGVRVMAALTGFESRKVPSPDWRMFINSGSVHIVAPREVFDADPSLVPTLETHANLPLPSDTVPVA